MDETDTDRNEVSEIEDKKVLSKEEKLKEEKLNKLRMLSNFARKTTKSSAFDLAEAYSNLKTAGYEKDEIISAIQDADLETIREFSAFLFLSNSYYRMPLLNIEGGAMLHYVLTPLITEEMTPEDVLDNHLNIQAWENSMLSKKLLREMLASYLLFGAYYGYQFKSGKKYYIQRLDHNYCRLGNQIDGQDIIEFNFDYFEDADDENFEYFPKDFKSLYTQASSGEDMWYPLDVKNSIAICTHNAFPVLSGSFTSFLDEDNAVAVTMDSLEADNTKMVTMDIPIDDETGEVLADIDEVTVFLNMIMDSIDDSISVVMSPYQLGFKSFEENKMSGNSDKRDYLKKRMMEGSLGSPAIFGDATTQTGYYTYYRMLENIIQQFLDKLAYVMEYKVNNVSSKSISYKLEFLNVTSWNKDSWFATSKELLGYGGSVSLPAMISTGMNITTYASLLKFEEMLGIKDLLVPPATSHTQTADGTSDTTSDSDGAETDEGSETQDRGGE